MMDCSGAVYWLHHPFPTHLQCQFHLACSPFSPRVLFSGRSSADLRPVLVPAQWMPVTRVFVSDGASPPPGFSSDIAGLVLSLCSLKYIFKSPCQVSFCFKVWIFLFTPRRGGRKRDSFGTLRGEVKWLGKTALLIRFSTPCDLELFIVSYCL